MPQGQVEVGSSGWTVRKDRSEGLGGLEVAVLQRENRDLVSEVERLRDLLEKCTGDGAEKHVTFYEVRKMKSQIAQLSRQHRMMNDEIKVIC